MKNPKIVFWDLETLPDMDKVMEVFPKLGDYPGLTLKATVNSIICFGYKIYGEKKVRCINAWDFPNWKENVNDDSELVKEAYRILQDAQAVVTHNGKRFDWKFLQTRLAVHKQPFLDRIHHIDTCAVSKGSLFGFNNRLNTLAQIFTDEQKLENGGWDLWVKVRQRDPKAMALMTKYCKQDVNLLEQIYLKMRPLMTNIPNYNLFGDGSKVCPACGSSRIYSHGLRASKTNLYRRYMCQDCGSTFKTNARDEMPRT